MSGKEHAHSVAERLAPSRRANERDFSIRFHLIWLVLMTAAPVALFAGYMVQRNATSEQATLERGLQESVRALGLAVDRELARTQAILGTLALSKSIAEGDLSAFHQEARAAAELVPGAWFVLSEPSSQQVVNTLVPFGEPLPTGNLTELFRKVAMTGEPSISNLFTGAMAGRNIISSIIRVNHNGRVWILDMAFEPRVFNQLLAAQDVPSYGIAAITDGNGRIIARSSDTENYIGRMGADFWVRGTKDVEGFLSGQSMAGRAVDVAYRQSELSEWTVGLAVYRDEVAAPLRRTWWTVVGGGAALLGLGLLLAAMMSKRIADAVCDLATSASFLGRNLPGAEQRWSIREVNQVHDALVEADRAIAARMRETEQLAAEHAAREEAEKQSRNKDVFLATLVHELRSPLSGVLNGISVLDKTCSDKPQANHVLALVRRQATHLRLLLEELLDAARVSLDRINLQPEPLDLRSVIELATQAESAGIEQKEQTLSLSLPERPVIVSGDELRLRQIVGNLLRNANKYSPIGSRVIVALREEGDHALISVSDTGLGIPKENLEAIFELFVRLPNSSEQPGLGIGLPLVKRLVQLHGGDIKAASAGPGRGATFTVRLPCSDLAQLDRPLFIPRRHDAPHDRGV